MFRKKVTILVIFTFALTLTAGFLSRLTTQPHYLSYDFSDGFEVSLNDKDLGVCKDSRLRHFFKKEKLHKDDVKARPTGNVPEVLT